MTTPADVAVRTIATTLHATGWNVRCRSACDYFTGKETALQVVAHRPGHLVRLRATVDLFDADAWTGAAEVDGRPVPLPEVPHLVGATR